MDEAGFDLDASTTQAWRRFQGRLGDRLTELRAPEVVVVEAEARTAGTPYVRFSALDDGRVRLEVGGTHRLSQEHTTELPAAEGDRLAVMAVRVLREVCDVPHPAFLSADALAADEADTGEPPGTPATADPEGPLAVLPESPEHLRQLVAAALTPVLDKPPEADEDGDFPVPTSSTTIYVRVVEEAPVLEMFAVVAEARDTDRAAVEVRLLNRDVRFVKFVLVGGVVVATLLLPAWPFVPAHLRTMVTGMVEKVDAVAADLAARLDAAPDTDEDEEDLEDMPPVVSTASGAGATDLCCLEPAMSVLRQLGTEGADPELAAGLCGFDRGNIVRLLTESERQESDWSELREQARRAGDDEEAAACDGEALAWTGITGLLRGALRLVVERSLGRRPDPPTVRPPADGRPRPAARWASKPLPPRPAPRRRVADLDDLLQLYDCDDLYQLDARLSEESVCVFEVFDSGEGIEVHQDEAVTRIRYPFALEEFEAAVTDLEDEYLARERES